MSATDYLIVLSQGKSFKPLQDRFNQLEGFYNGIGYIFPTKVESDLRQLLSPLNARILKMPLGEGQSFNSLRQSFKSAFFRDKLLEKEHELFLLRTQLGLDKLTEESIEASNIQDYSKKELIEAIHECEKLKKSALWAEGMEKALSANGNALPIVPIGDRIKSHNETMKKYRGKKYLGLCVSTISEFNDKMLGLRKLILLAAAPNVGKTALTIQLAKEVLLKEPDACLVYVSLEMDAEEIFTRMNLYLSGLNFNTYVLGSQQTEGGIEYHNLFSQDELEKIDRAAKVIEKIGDRLQIIDAASCAVFNAETIIKYVERLKSKTGCNRAIVVIDYLQVWPAPSGTFTSDLEGDKWRIGEIKKIRDALNTVNQDPVIVISEARKPSDSSNAWAGDLADVMGSARGTYTPDAVLLLNPLSAKQLEDLWKNKRMPKIDYQPDTNDIEETKDGTRIKAFLAHHGIAICSLKMPKGRDGMKKFHILLAFHFLRNRFENIDWPELAILAGGKIGESTADENSTYNRGINIKKAKK